MRVRFIAWFAIFAGALVMCAGLTACIKAVETTPLRIGTNVWPGYEPLYLADQLSYFSQDEVDLVEYLSASEVIRAFRNRAIEAAALTLDEALILLEHNIPARLILITDISHGGDVIMAKPELKNITDLSGKRVGVEGNALGAYVLSRALDIHNVELKTVELVHLEVNRHEKAFKDNEVDAIVTFEPTRSKLLAVGAKEVFTSKEIPGEVVDVVIVHQDYLDKHPEKLKNLADGWFNALKYIREQPDDAAQRMSGRLKVAPENVLESFDGLILPSREDHQSLIGGENPELKQTINRLQAVMLENDLLENLVNVDDFLVPEIVLGTSK